MSNHPIACVVSPNKDAYSETFIRAHINRLPTTVKILYGYHPAYCGADGQPLLRTPGMPRRLARAVERRVFQRPPDYFEVSAVRRFLIEQEVDVVLAEFGPTGVALMDLCRSLTIPLVVHFHGYDAYLRTTLANEGQRYPELFKAATAIIAVSHDMERQLLHLGVPRDKLYYNPYGVDVTLFHNAQPAQAQPVFVAVGRFVDKKAPHLTLMAFKRVVELMPQARLIMIGDGVLHEACRQLANAWGIAHAVTFAGVCYPTEVAAALQQARAFVQHSIQTSNGDSEGTPVVILEAGAAGLPVVATRHAGIPDVVLDEETGLLVDEGDVVGMADRMLRLASDPLLAARLGQAARQRIFDRFSLEISITNLWNIITACLPKVS